MAQFEKRLKRLQKVFDQLVIICINLACLRLAQIGVIIAQQQLTQKESQQFLEELKKQVPEMRDPYPLQTDFIHQKKTKEANLERLEMTLILFLKLPPKVREVVVQKLQSLPRCGLDIKIVDWLILLLGDQPSDEVESEFEEYIYGCFPSKRGWIRLKWAHHS